MNAPPCVCVRSAPKGWFGVECGVSREWKLRCNGGDVHFFISIPAVGEDVCETTVVQEPVVAELCYLEWTSEAGHRYQLVIRVSEAGQRTIEEAAARAEEEAMTEVLRQREEEWRRQQEQHRALEERNRIRYRQEEQARQLRLQEQARKEAEEKTRTEQLRRRQQREELDEAKRTYVREHAAQEAAQEAAHAAHEAATVTAETASKAAAFAMHFGKSATDRFANNIGDFGDELLRGDRERAERKVSRARREEVAAQVLAKRQAEEAREAEEAAEQELQKVRAQIRLMVSVTLHAHRSTFLRAVFFLTSALCTHTCVSRRSLAPCSPLPNCTMPQLPRGSGWNHARMFLGPLQSQMQTNPCRSRRTTRLRS